MQGREHLSRALMAIFAFIYPLWNVVYLNPATFIYALVDGSTIAVNLV